jgi:hypothetical protein
MTKFSLEPETNTGLAPFPEVEKGVTYGPEHTDTVSNRFALVLGDQNPGPDVINNAISTGDKKRWEQILQTREQISVSQRRNDLIREVAASRDPRALPTPDELRLVQSLTDEEAMTMDVDTVLERQYSDFFTNTISSLPGNEVIGPALEEDEEASLEVLDRVSSAQQRVLIAQDKLEQVQKKWEDAGMFSKGVAFLKGVIPGYNWWKTADRIEDAPTVSLLSGNNLGEQVAYLYTLPPAEFKKTLDKAVDELAEDNLLVAQQFAQAVISYSSYEEGMNNLFDVVDLADVATVGLTAAGKLARGMAKSTTAIMQNPKNISRQAAEVGMIKESAVASVVEDAVKGDLSGVQRFSDPNNPRALEERLPSLYSPQRAFTGRSTLEATANNRLRETILRSAELTREFMGQGRLVDRLEPEQVKLAADEAFDKIKDTFTNVNHHIIDTQLVSSIPARPVVTAPPTPPKGHTRFYYGSADEAHDVTKQDDLWVTPDQTYARDYRRGAQDNTIWYVDIPDTELGKLRIRDEVNGYNISGKLPKEWAQKARRLSGQTGAKYEITPAEMDALTNTAQVRVRFGKRDGSLFSSEWSAQMFAKKYIGIKTDDYTIKQEGVGGFFIEVAKPVADVGRFRSLELPTELKSSDSLSSQFLRNLRSPDYIVSEPNVRARGRVVHGQEFLAEYMKKVTEPFAGKSKEWVDELDKVLKSNRASRKYYQTVEEFEQNFLAINGKAPTEDQASAYFTYVQLNDLDYLVRDADIVKQKTRLGGERISFSMNVDGTGVTKEFDGVVRENLPYDSKSFFHVSVVQNGIETKRKSSRFFGPQDRADFDQLIKDGYKVVLDPGDATYYLIKDFKRSKIQLGNLNRVEGGHNEYRYEHFIKQGDVKTGQDKVSRYRGDKSLFVATTEKQAREIAEFFEKARQLVKNNDPGAKKFIDDNLPISYAEFIKKVKSGDIDINVPIIATRKGQRTVDLYDYRNDFEYFDDVMSSEHNVFGTVGGRYTTERQDTPLDVLASENGVIVRTDLEPMLDPLETLRVSTANMLDVRVAHDYKLKSIQDWVQEFGHLIDAPLNKVAANPGYYLENPTFRKGANPERVVVAQNVRNAILQLQNYKNPVESSMHVWRDKLLSTVYEKGGEDWRAAVEGRMFDAKDVQTFLRKAAFNLKLGMFNPKQLFLQASSAINVIAVSGLKNGVAASRALPVMRMALMTENKDVLAGLMNRFGKVTGWQKDDFLEMVESFKQSGYSVVSNDVAYLEDFRPKTMKSGKAGEVWSHHTDFFKEGELTARQMAYAAAWREWRDANPGKALDRFAESRILARAKNLTTNMTRDSNASWQKGWASVATQFMGYQVRFMEQLWDGGLLNNGRKLTRQEKLRLVTGMSMMYGAPVYVSATTSFPMREWFRDWMAEQGIPYDDSYLEPMLDGILPSMFEAMTGLDMNWSEAYGPNGMPLFTDILNEDATWYDILGGASGGVMIEGASRIKTLVGNLMTPDDQNFPVTAQDLIEPLKIISTVASADKLYEALNTHRYLSRNGTYLTDISGMEALTSAIFGVNPDRVSDAYSQISALKASKDSRMKYQREAEKNFKQAIAAAKRNDFESYKVYKSRAWQQIIAGGLNLSEGNTAYKRAVADEPMDQSVIENFERELQRRQTGLTEGE